MKRFFSMIESHVRNIDVLTYKKKIVFQIPLYDDILYKDYKVKVDDDYITITFEDKGLKEKKDLSNQ
jgi:hypothetical protein